MDARTLGALIGVVFGCAWGIAGASGLRGRGMPAAMLFVLAVSAALVAALLRVPAHGSVGTFRGSVYGVAVALESIGIIVAVALLRRFDHATFMMPVVGFIVGLHFVGLWRATDLRLFAWVAVAICVVCAFAAMLPPDGATDGRRVFAGIGCAVVLWTAALTTLL
jgi:hypothetical protein